jgi:hypothetical protein
LIHSIEKASINELRAKLAIKNLPGKKNIDKNEKGG